MNQSVVPVHDKQLEGAAGTVDGKQGWLVHLSAGCTGATSQVRARKRGHMAGDGVADE
jgi:hypothetical protein